MIVCKTKQVGFEPVFESSHSSSISYGSWDFIPNLGGTIAEGTPTSQLLQLEHWAAADWTSAGLAWAHKETEANVDNEYEALKCRKR